MEHDPRQPPPFVAPQSHFVVALTQTIGNDHLD